MALLQQRIFPCSLWRSNIGQKLAFWLMAPRATGIRPKRPLPFHRIIVWFKVYTVVALTEWVSITRVRV